MRSSAVFSGWLIWSDTPQSILLCCLLCIFFRWRTLSTSPVPRPSVSSVLCRCYCCCRRLVSTLSYTLSYPQQRISCDRSSVHCIKPIILPRSQCSVDRNSVQLARAMIATQCPYAVKVGIRFEEEHRARLVQEQVQLVQAYTETMALRRLSAGMPMMTIFAVGCRARSRSLVLETL